MQRLPAELKVKWLGCTAEYEGLPIVLRVRAHADTRQNRAHFTLLLAITHHLSRVRPDGLPEPDYNDQLLDLDLAIVSALDQTREAITVLIETFHAQRTYYAYGATAAHGSAALTQVRRRHPRHRLSLASRPDPSWGLLQCYRALFPWEEP